MKKVKLWFKKFFTILWHHITRLGHNLFGKNNWGWTHLVSSAIICSIHFRLFPRQLTWETAKFEIGIVFGIALFWEVVEYITEIKFAGKSVSDVYGSRVQYLQDTIGDILFALMGWGIALI